MTATVMASVRRTGSENSRTRPAQTRAHTPASVACASPDRVPPTRATDPEERCERMPITLAAAIRKQPADATNGSHAATANSTPPASGPARSSASVSTVTNRALARSRCSGGTMRSSSVWAAPSATVSAEVSAKPTTQSSAMLAVSVSTAATRASESTTRARCAVAIAAAGLSRSTSAPAGIATTSHGSVDAAATTATAAGDGLIETAKRGSATTRRPSPVNDPAQTTTSCRNWRGNAGAGSEVFSIPTRAALPGPGDPSRMPAVHHPEYTIHDTVPQNRRNHRRLSLYPFYPGHGEGNVNI